VLPCEAFRGLATHVAFRARQPSPEAKRSTAPGGTRSREHRPGRSARKAGRSRERTPGGSKASKRACRPTTGEPDEKRARPGPTAWSSRSRGPRVPGSCVASLFSPASAGRESTWQTAGARAKAAGHARGSSRWHRSNANPQGSNGSRERARLPGKGKLEGGSRGREQHETRLRSAGRVTASGEVGLARSVSCVPRARSEPSKGARTPGTARRGSGKPSLSAGPRGSTATATPGVTVSRRARIPGEAALPARTSASVLARSKTATVAGQDAARALKRRPNSTRGVRGHIRARGPARRGRPQGRSNGEGGALEPDRRYSTGSRPLQETATSREPRPRTGDRARPTGGGLESLEGTSSTGTATRRHFPRGEWRPARPCR
jgi:hypothetical protein